MMIRTRLARLESQANAGRLPLAVRAWLGETLSPLEQEQAALEAAQPLPPIDWNTFSEKDRKWLQQ